VILFYWGDARFKSLTRSWVLSLVDAWNRRDDAVRVPRGHPARRVHDDVVDRGDERGVRRQLKGPATRSLVAKTATTATPISAHTLRNGFGSRGWRYVRGHSVFIPCSCWTSPKGPADLLAPRSEDQTNPLIEFVSDFTRFSERALTSQEDVPDFDSAIRRFESSRPSQRGPSPRDVSVSCKNSDTSGTFGASPNSISHRFGVLIREFQRAVFFNIQNFFEEDHVPYQAQSGR
jgi:hypothetical protein